MYFTVQVSQCYYQMRPSELIRDGHVTFCRGFSEGIARTRRVISAGTSWGSTRNASRDSVCRDAGQVYLNGSVAEKVKSSRLTDELL